MKQNSSKKYTAEININLPRKRVVELFDNQDNLKKWMSTLLKFEHLIEDAGKTGGYVKTYLQYARQRNDND